LAAGLGKTEEIGGFVVVDPVAAGTGAAAGKGALVVLGVEPAVVGVTASLAAAEDKAIG